MLSRFHLIPEHYGQTDRRMDRIAISISLTRDKKRHIYYGTPTGTPMQSIE